MHKNNAVNLKINKIILAQRQISFVVVLFLMFSGKIFGQENMADISTPKLSKTATYITKMPYKTTFVSKYFLNDESAGSGKPIISLKIISPSFYSCNLGFICKKELQLEKVVVVPFRFRLGSLAYVNYLEQKPNAVNPLR